jgi:hypothetical protein
VKKIKILSVLMVILLAMPGYYRNRQAVDRFAVGMWGGVEGAWLHFAFESKKVGTVFSDAVSGKRTGKSIPSQREAEIEAERASQKQIDEQEQKETTGEDGGAATIGKMRESDPPYSQRESDEAVAGNTGKPGQGKKPQ